MRTTVTLDPDVEALLRERMRERDGSFKDTLDQALRSALSRGGGRVAERCTLKTIKIGYRPAIALDQALSLAAAAEGEEIIRKLSLRKAV